MKSTCQNLWDANKSVLRKLTVLKAVLETVLEKIFLTVLEKMLSDKKLQLPPLKNNNRRANKTQKK